MGLYLPLSVDEQTRKYYEHAFSTSLHKVCSNNDMMDNPVCPRCEAVAFKDKGWTTERIGTCARCGFHGKMPTVLQMYLREQKMMRR